MEEIADLSEKTPPIALITQDADYDEKCAQEGLTNHLRRSRRKKNFGGGLKPLWIKMAIADDRKEDANPPSSVLGRPLSCH